VSRHTREISLVLAIVALGGVLAVAAPGFFTPTNLRDLTMTNMPVLIVALGMTLIILTGQIDISIGSVFAICSVLAGVTAKTGGGILVSASAACAAGALMGAVNGALITKAKIPSIVVTLATMVALRDGLRWMTQGAWVQDLPPDFQAFGLTQEASQAITAAIAAALAGAMIWGLRNLAAGRAVYATGSNAEGARLAGIEPSRVIFCVFTLTGALTGAAALLNAVRFNQVPSNAGIGMEMQVIASVIVGGVSVNGGRGTVAGALLGVVLLGMIGPALTFLGISAYWERAIQGGIILTAVAIDALRGQSGAYAGDPAAQRA
jgi:rhamnose transport system permease protein